MSAKYNLEKHLLDLEEWIYQLARCMHRPNEPEKALQALKSVFGVIRSRCTFEESLQFLDLLPLSLKAVYLDGWHIGVNTPEQLHSMEELMDDVIASEPAESNWYNSSREELRNAVSAIFKIIGSYAAYTELPESQEKVGYLPMDMQQYFRKGNLNIENSYAETSIWLS